MLLCKKLKKMTIISDIKKFIADNKLSDEDIKAKWLTKPDTKDQTDAAKSDGEQSDVDSDEQEDVEEDSTTEDQIESMIKKILDEKLKEMKSGKPKPKKVNKNAHATQVQKISNDSFQLI